MKIRPFEPDDAPAVAALWHYWFRDKTRAVDADLLDLVRQIYVLHPQRDPEVPSLVAVDEAGRLLGFLGATVTPLAIDGRPGRLAGLFPPIVDPDLAATTVASFLLRKFLAGPQDLTMSDGGHPKFERIWTALGGQVDTLASLRWVAPFRPARLALRLADPSAAWARLLAPVAGGADQLARRLAPRRLTVAAATATSTPAAPEAYGAAVDDLRADARLRPAYAPGYLTWLFDRMVRLDRLGPLRVARVEDARGATLGAYVAFLPAGGIGRVFALDARPAHAGAVFDRLLADADAAGVAALMGRMAPRWRRPVADRGCLVRTGGSLRLLHAHDPDLVDAACLGRAALSRLEGENWYWWGIDPSHAGGAVTTERPADAGRPHDGPSAGQPPRAAQRS